LLQLSFSLLTGAFISTATGAGSFAGKEKEASVAGIGFELLEAGAATGDLA
jgi:hypothetical protein